MSVEMIALLTVCISARPALLSAVVETSRNE